MSFTQAVHSVITQYTGFSGRARRSEYWWYFLFEMIVNIVLSTLKRVTGMTLFDILLAIFCLGLLLPGIAVCVRRFHDIGKSGWFTLMVLIPVLGSIIMMIMFLKDSQPGTNAYGPNPKEMSQASF